LLLIASCGKTSEEKAEIAIISCNILEASPATDASQRIKEINRARQELNEEPFLGKDDEIIEAITYNLCKELVLNDELYEESLLTTIEQERIAREKKLEAAREEKRKKIKKWTEKNKETLAKITPLEFVKFANYSSECYEAPLPSGESRPLIICYEINNFTGFEVTWEVIFKNGYIHEYSNDTIQLPYHMIYDFHLDEKTLIELENSNDLKDHVGEINIYVQGINSKYSEDNNLSASEIRALSNPPFDTYAYPIEILGIKYQIYPSP
jgi:hypothetical protein